MAAAAATVAAAAAAVTTTESYLTTPTATALFVAILRSEARHIVVEIMLSLALLFCLFFIFILSEQGWIEAARQ